MKLAPIALTAAQVAQLVVVAATGAHPRERRRAQAILSHSRGLTLYQLAAAYAVDRDTVRAWLTRFEQGGADALAEGARAGRPPKLGAAAKKGIAWVGAACQQVRRLVPRIWQELCIRLSVSTLCRTLRQAGYSWKRMRRSLKAQRDPQAFTTAQQQLAALHRAEQRGELALYCVDGVRFSRQAPVPYAWQLRGQPPVALPAERGAGGGYSVLGFWRPADALGSGRQLFMGVRAAPAFAAELFVLAVADFLASLTQPTVLVLDNASIHKSLLVKAQLAQWAEQGLTLYFLPPYSPELNRIEILWRFCQHYWLTPEAYQTPQTLLQHVTELLQAIGTENYQITFA